MQLIIYAIVLLKGIIVPVLLGRNVSFSLTISNISDDIILINHNATDFTTSIWPEYNNYVKTEKPDRVKVAVFNKTESNTVTVIVDILNVTQNDLGMYNAVLQMRPTDIKDSVLLELMDITMIPKIAIARNHSLDSNLVLECRLSSTSSGKVYWKLNGSFILNRSRYLQNDTFLYIMNLTANDKYNLYKCEVPGSELESNPYSIQNYVDHYITKTSSLIRDTEETFSSWTTTSSMRKDTEGIYNYTTTASAPKVDKEADSPENRLLYIIFGMGAVLAAVFIAYIQHKIRTCLRVDTESNNGANCDNVDEVEILQGVCQSGKYWTIVSNAEGELRTAIETDVELRREPLLIEPKCVPSIIGSKESVRSDDIGISTLDGYLNPISSSAMGLDGYINPIHTGPVDTDLSCICSSTEVRKFVSVQYEEGHSREVVLTSVHIYAHYRVARRHRGHFVHFDIIVDTN